jgi:hypothetical protein
MQNHPEHPREDYKLFGCLTAGMCIFLGGFLGCTTDLIVLAPTYFGTSDGPPLWPYRSFLLFGAVGWLLWLAGSNLRKRRRHDQ